MRFKLNNPNDNFWESNFSEDKPNISWKDLKPLIHMVANKIDVIVVNRIKGVSERLNYDESFKCFKDVVIRHTLFRPPHIDIVYVNFNFKFVFKECNFMFLYILSSSFCCSVDYSVSHCRLFFITILKTQIKQNILELFAS